MLLAAEGASAGRRGRRPCGLPGDGRQREVAVGWGHPALRMGIWKRCGVYVSSRFRAAAR